MEERQAAGQFGYPGMADRQEINLLAQSQSPSGCQPSEGGFFPWPDAKDTRLVSFINLPVKR